MDTTSNSIFKTSETLHIRIETIKQRINKLENDKQHSTLSEAEERELSELYAKLEPLTRRLTEIHQMILDYSVRIAVDGERYIVIEYFVNHTSRAQIVNNDFYERSWVYRVIKKYQKL